MITSPTQIFLKVYAKPRLYHRSFRFTATRISSIRRHNNEHTNHPQYCRLRLPMAPKYAAQKILHWFKSAFALVICAIRTRIIIIIIKILPGIVLLLGVKWNFKITLHQHRTIKHTTKKNVPSCSRINSTFYFIYCNILICCY